MANSNGWGDGAANNSIGWGQGANNAIAWGDSHAKSWASATDIVGLTTDPAASAYFAATGITGATQQAAIDNLVKGLKTDGIWSKMKAVYPFVTDNRNLLSYTDTLTNSYWQKSGLTLTTSQSDPNGGTNATQISVASATNAYLYGTVTPTVVGQTYTASVYIKGDASGSVSFRVDSGGSSPSNPINYTTSWQRFTYTFVAGYTGADWVIGGYNTWTGGETIYVYAPQLELGSTATTYQPILTTQQAYIASQFKYNLVNPVDSDAAFRLVFNGGWTHSSNGATPNGTNGYADTKLVPSSVLSLNSTSHSVYSRSSSPIGMMGGVNDANYLILNNPTSTTIASQLNTISTNLITGNIVNSQGLLMANRVDSLSVNVWRNSTKVASDSKISTGLPALAYFISGRNSGGVSANYDSKQYAFYHLGDGLTDTEAANLYARVQAYQTALSRQV